MVPVLTILNTAMLKHLMKRITPQLFCSSRIAGSLNWPTGLGPSIGHGVDGATQTRLDRLAPTLDC